MVVIEDQYFTDGLQDEIRTRLSGVAALRISSRTSVMQYRDSPKNVREIGRELGVSQLFHNVLRSIGLDPEIGIRAGWRSGHRSAGRDPSGAIAQQPCFGFRNRG